MTDKGPDPTSDCQRLKHVGGNCLYVGLQLTGGLLVSSSAVWFCWIITVQFLSIRGSTSVFIVHNVFGIGCDFSL